mmetsp:Transcript_17107/g.40828  ORF Transcript_17107/g.40828 Transcript_17107/m.40828 type:complete len:473 (-) Transcript_17107:138-1556(-)
MPPEQRRGRRPRPTAPAGEPAERWARAVPPDHGRWPPAPVAAAGTRGARHHGLRLALAWGTRPPLRPAAGPPARRPGGGALPSCGVRFRAPRRHAAPPRPAGQPRPGRGLGGSASRGPAAPPRGAQPAALPPPDGRRRGSRLAAAAPDAAAARRVPPADRCRGRFHLPAQPPTQARARVVRPPHRPRGGEPRGARQPGGPRPLRLRAAHGLGAAPPRLTPLALPPLPRGCPPAHRRGLRVARRRPLEHGRPPPHRGARPQRVPPPDGPLARRAALGAAAPSPRGRARDPSERRGGGGGDSGQRPPPASGQGTGSAPAPGGRGGAAAHSRGRLRLIRPGSERLCPSGGEPVPGASILIRRVLRHPQSLPLSPRPLLPGPILPSFHLLPSLPPSFTPPWDLCGISALNGEGGGAVGSFHEGATVWAAVPVFGHCLAFGLWVNEWPREGIKHCALGSRDAAGNPTGQNSEQRALV